MPMAHGSLPSLPDNFKEACGYTVYFIFVLSFFAKMEVLYHVDVAATKIDTTRSRQ